MTTKAPSGIEPASPGTLESIAYDCVKGIPTQEGHDLDRLGYTLWLWLKHRKDPLETAVHAAGVRFLVPEEEAVERVRQNLTARGISA